MRESALPEEDQLRIAKYRLLLVIVAFVYGLGLTIANPAMRAMREPILYLGSFWLAAAAIHYTCRVRRILPLLSLIFIVVSDVLVVTMLLQAAGTITSPFLLVIPFFVLFYSLVEGVRFGFFMAMLFMVAYYPIIWLEHYGYLTYAPYSPDNRAPAITHSENLWGVMGFFTLLVSMTPAMVAILLRRLFALQEQKESFLREESLAALQNLVAGTAHELGNPLGMARSVAQELFDEIKEGRAGDAKELEESVGVILRATERADTILHDLSNLTDRALPQATEIFVWEMTAKSVRALCELRGWDERRVKMLGDEDVRIQANPLEIERVFHNILKNAAEWADQENPKITLSIDRDDKRLFWRCRDNGPGFTEESLKGAFQPFFTTRRAEGRRGLGLYFVHETVRRLGGVVTIDSGTEHGGQVTVTLPLG